ncbi:MAG TPA: glycosyl hydrolase family 18 protein [Polyangiaceae bacterium]|nr:glycosyl hydrolase family 18 protein [Polyangiaceae bacterium]
MQLLRSTWSVAPFFVAALALGACGETADGGDGLGGAPGAGGTVGVGGTAGTGGTGAGGTGTGGAPSKTGPRVVGYLPTYRNMDPAALDWATLTHLDIAFANSMDGGGVDFDSGARESIAPLVQKAHENGVKVLASIAGAAGGAAVSGRITPGNVDAYVTALLDMVSRYQLDGIDVDIEGEYVNGDYEPFVIKLSAALPADKLLTAAVATWNGDDFSSAALAEYDFINVMSYDHCGTWTDACEHSSLADTNSELAYWSGERAIPANEVVVGVPFYGYRWGGGTSDAVTYGELVLSFPQAKTTDWFVVGGDTYSLNSATTIATKAQLAQQYGGIMIWELGQDATGADSLMKVIADAQP